MLLSLWFWLYCVDRDSITPTASRAESVEDTEPDTEDDGDVRDAADFQMMRQTMQQIVKGRHVQTGFLSCNNFKQ